MRHGYNESLAGNYSVSFTTTAGGAPLATAILTDAPLRDAQKLGDDCVESGFATGYTIAPDVLPLSQPNRPRGNRLVACPLDCFYVDYDVMLSTLRAQSVREYRRAARCGETRQKWSQWSA